MHAMYVLYVILTSYDTDKEQVVHTILGDDIDQMNFDAEEWIYYHPAPQGYWYNTRYDLKGC